jgi:hypothetical protein
MFRDAGFTRPECTALDVPTAFKDFEDYWTPFLGGQGAAPGYCSTLSEEQRARLSGRLRATLPVDPDGAIRLIARAWAVRGTRAAAWARGG